MEFFYPRNTLRALRSSFSMCPYIPDRIWNLAVLVFLERRKPEYPEKNLSEQGENQEQTQPTYDAGTGNRTRDTLMESECSHHCATPALTSIINRYLRYIRIVNTVPYLQHHTKSTLKGQSAYNHNLQYVILRRR